VARTEVFGVQPAQQAPLFIDDEVRLGVNVADAAHAAGVRHLVYSSVGGADRASGISHWSTKWKIEQHIRRPDLQATILRPVQLMENHASRMYGVTGEAALIRMIPATASVQLIAVTPAYPVFAVMFGYGLVQLASRQTAAGGDARAVLLRRNVWLIIFGFGHATLLYFRACHAVVLR
jgi:hypothetical protein